LLILKIKCEALATTKFANDKSVVCITIHDLRIARNSPKYNMLEEVVREFPSRTQTFTNFYS